ncbi:MAG: class I SAM-dependent methyltransferase [Candidatus Omnitrophica bacterium]|nr:class I SAM-dependent methyltransferase [Candidatus Omnitrophota bacterium]
MNWQPSLCLNTAERRNLRRLAGLVAGACAKPRWLVIGRGDDRLRELTGELIWIDIAEVPNIHVRGDVVRLPFQPGQFDGVIAKAVLEHVEDARSAVQELHRVLKPGGHCYIEVPFLQPFHEGPDDYQRLTRHGLERLMREFHRIECGVCVGPTAALIWTLQVYLSLACSLNQERLFRAWLMVFGTLLSPLKYADLLMGRLTQADRIASCCYYLGQKRWREAF